MNEQEKTNQPVQLLSINCSTVLFLSIVALGFYAWKVQLSPSQLTELIKTLIWPIITLIIGSFFKTEIGGFLNRITGAEFPGGVKLQTGQSQPSTDLVQIDQHVPDEKTEFEQINVELVINTKGALLWIHNQKKSITISAFLQAFGLPNPPSVGTDLVQEKWAIFNALQIRGLLEFQGPDHLKISPKGERFLTFIKYL